MLTRVFLLSERSAVNVLGNFHVDRTILFESKGISDTTTGGYGYGYELLLQVHVLHVLVLVVVFMGRSEIKTYIKPFAAYSLAVLKSIFK